MDLFPIIDAHSHLWLRQDTQWDGKPIRTLRNGRSLFLGEEVQMVPPFIIDGRNTAEVFLSNMDYAQVSAAVVVQEFIDGLQNDYLAEVTEKYPDRFFVFGMADYLKDGFFEQAQSLLDQGFLGLAIPGHRLLGRSLTGAEMRSLLKLRSTAYTVQYADGVFRFTTTGSGHGVGMSQYGANVMAKSGSTYREILLHYYPNTELCKLNKV